MANDNEVIRRGDVLALPVLIIPYDAENVAALTAVDRYRAAIAALPADDRVAKLVEALRFGVDLIEGDSFGSEWIRGQADFKRMARAALAAWETGK